MFADFAQVSDVGEIADTESVTGKCVVLHLDGFHMEVAKIERGLVDEMHIVGRSPWIEMLLERIGKLTLDLRERRLVDKKGHRLVALAEDGVTAKVGATVAKNAFASAIGSGTAAATVSALRRYRRLWQRSVLSPQRKPVQSVLLSFVVCVKVIIDDMILFPNSSAPLASKCSWSLSNERSLASTT